MQFNNHILQNNIFQDFSDIVKLKIKKNYKNSDIQKNQPKKNKNRHFKNFQLYFFAHPFAVLRVGLFAVPHFRASFVRYAPERLRRRYYPLRISILLTSCKNKSKSLFKFASSF